MYYSKKILKKSKEYRFQKEIGKKDDKKLFLPIEKTEEDNNFIILFWRMVPNTMYDFEKISKKQKWDCWQQICSSLSFLHSLHIIHCDVHLKNILTEKNKYFLIDFGISKKVKSFYDKYHLEWKEDEFQLLWNLILRHNSYPNDFSQLRKRLQEETKKNQSLLEKEIQYCLPKDLSKKYFSILLSKKPILIKSKMDKIKFKFFLQRLYFLSIIFLEHPDIFSQKMYHSFNWK